MISPDASDPDRLCPDPDWGRAGGGGGCLNFPLAVRPVPLARNLRSRLELRLTGVGTGTGAGVDRDGLDWGEALGAGDGTDMVIDGLATGSVGLVIAGTGMAIGGTGLRCGGVAGAGVDALLA